MPILEDEGLTGQERSFVIFGDEPNRVNEKVSSRALN